MVGWIFDLSEIRITIGTTEAVLIIGLLSWIAKRLLSWYGPSRARHHVRPPAIDWHHDDQNWLLERPDESDIST